VLNATNLADQDLNVIVTAPGASDKHTYFGPSANTNLTLGVGGAEKVRITNAGNVGIGTSAPGQKLSVAGVIQSTSGGVMFPDGTTQATASTSPAVPIIKLGRFSTSINANTFYTLTGYWNTAFPDGNYILTCNLVWNDSVQYNNGSVLDVWLDHIIQTQPGQFTAVIVNTMPITEYYLVNCIAMEPASGSNMHPGATTESSGVSKAMTVGPEQPVGIKPE